MFLSLIVIIQIIYSICSWIKGWIGSSLLGPKMGSEFIPREVFSSNPQWNFLNGVFGVQFIHRILAIFIVIISIFIYYKTKFLKLENPQKISLKIIFSLIFIQFVLGVFTLIYSVPISLAILHQLGHFFYYYQ